MSDELEAALAAREAGLAQVAAAESDIVRTLFAAFLAEAVPTPEPTPEPDPVSPPPPPPPPAPGELSAVGTVVEGDGVLTTTGPITWKIANGTLSYNSIAVAEAGNVTRMEVIAAYSDPAKTTVKATNQDGDFAYDPDYSGAGKLDNGWVICYVYEASLLPDAPYMDPSLSNPEDWKPFLPANALFYPDDNSNWNDTWGDREMAVSDWDEGKLANGPWLYDHVLKNGDGSVTLISDADGNGQIQHFAKHTSGRVGVKIKTGNLRPDGILAPLWLYSGWREGEDGLGRFEFDFEFCGKTKLEINYHDGTWPGQNVHTIEGDFSNMELKLEIDWDMEEGWADFYLNDERIKRLTRQEVKGFGKSWPIKPMFPLYDSWVVDNDGWTGAPYKAENGRVETVITERMLVVRA